MSEPGKVVVTKTKLDILANAINNKANTPGPKTIDELVQTVNNMEVDSPDLFVVDIALPFSSEDSYGEYTDEAVADKTAQEILDAYNNGDQVVARVHYSDGVGYFAYLTYEPSTSSAWFGATWADDIMSPGALTIVAARVNIPPTSSEAIIFALFVLNV